MYKTPAYSATRQLIHDTLYHRTPIYGDVAGTNIGGKAKKKKKASKWNKYFATMRRRHPEWSIKRISTEYKRHGKPKRKRKTKKGGVIVGGQQSELIEYINDVKARYPYISPKMAMEMDSSFSGGVKYKRRGGALKAKGAKKNPWLQFIQYHRRMPKKYWQELYHYEKPLYKGSKEKQEALKIIRKIIPKRAVKQEIKRQLPEVKESQAKTMAEVVHEDLAQKLEEEAEKVPATGEGFFGGKGTKKGAKKNRWIKFLRMIKGKKIPKAYLSDIYYNIYMAEHKKTGKYPYIKQFSKPKMKPKKKAKKKVGKVPKQLSRWHKHVNKVKRANPGMEFKKVLQKASRTYKKGAGQLGGEMVIGPQRYYF